MIENAFKFMCRCIPVVLSDKGKRNLERCWENSSEEVWKVESISRHDECAIYSESGYVFEGAPLEWFIWD